VATIVPNPASLVKVDPVNGNISLLPNQGTQAQVNGVTLGNIVAVELETTGVLYTVPSGKTFRGALVVFAGGPSGTITLTDAAGPTVLATITCGVTLPLAPVIVSITSAGGSGNALTLAVTGSAAVISAVLAGYVH
jgi:hypothetical protein